jgi:hypothetical protein
MARVLRRDGIVKEGTIRKDRIETGAERVEAEIGTESIGVKMNFGPIIAK